MPLRELPTIHLNREDRFLNVLKRCKGLPTAITVVVHPCSDDALLGPSEPAERGLIDPILVGPPAQESICLGIASSGLTAAQLSLAPAELDPL